MIKITLALILGMAGLCDIIYGMLQGIDSIYVQYTEGCYHLIRGCIFFKIGFELAKD